MSTWASTYSITFTAMKDILNSTIAGTPVLWANIKLARQESELAINIRKATSIDEVSPKRTSGPRNLAM